MEFGIITGKYSIGWIPIFDAGQVMDFYIPNPHKRVKPLSEVMSRQEVRSILQVCGNNQKHRAIFMLLYSAGLRLTEVCHLKLSDIDSEGMQIRISQSKGKKDRYTVLSRVCLHQLRLYYRQARPKGGYLFNGQRKGEPMHRRSVQHALVGALKRTRITKHINVHTFRHTFAVHFLESTCPGCWSQRMAYLFYANGRPGILATVGSALGIAHNGSWRRRAADFLFSSILSHLP